ncbi:polyhomeotic-like protein 2 isoform X1 [Pyxicephalus adspersus]|uniref:polyhomeotic-like protein 2 isoform X1 n=1 Tax=Pyxicephalus adspersus TaxID=30357 RepID=UPI003B597FEF
MENEKPNPNCSRQTATDCQTVQVIQQALSRQPNTAAQYLQQMYAAQQQHLMLQTAALQQHQQHLNSAQLQSLAAQQAGLAVSRAAPGVNVSQQSPSQVTTINLTSSPQIIQRPQTVGSTAAPAPGITQQAVLLGNASSPTLSASQAQMYLRAQMLIFTPAATVSSIQSDVSSAANSSQAPPVSTQVQNLTVRGSVGEMGALNPTPLSTLAIKPATLSLHPVTKPAGCVGSHGTDSHKKGESLGTDSQTATGRATVSTHAIITPAYSPHLVQEPKPVLHQFVIQNQPHIQPRPVLPHTQPLTHQPQVSQGLSSPPITSQAPLVPSSSSVEADKQNPSSVHPSFRGQDGAVQCRILPPNSAVIFQIPSAQSMAPPLQDNLQKHCEPHRTQMTADAPTNHTHELHQTTPHDSSHTVQISSPALDMTSGNGSSPLPAAAIGSTPQNGENKPPQAVVKPQILTHVIEGFVIQEGAQPFPSQRSRVAPQVGRSSLLVRAQEKCQQGHLAEKLPQQDNNNTATTTDSDIEEPSMPESKSDGDPPKLKCELCGRVDFEYKFKRSKRFCSMACAKRYNVGCTKRVGLFHPDRSKLQKSGGPKHTRRRSRKSSLTDHTTDYIKQVSVPAISSSPTPLSVSSTLKHTNSQEDSSRCSDNSSFEEPLSPISASSSLSRQHHRDIEMTDLHLGDTLHLNNFLPSDPTKWNVEDVYEFIRSLPGCQEISEEFRAQEIDGQALLLLKEDHLMSTMNIKLGPALKIYARISMLKDS